VKTTESKPDQEDHSASKPQQEYDNKVLDIKQDAVKDVFRAEINESDATRRVYRRPLTPEEVKEADEIGYRVIGSATRLDGKHKRQDPIFAVVQVCYSLP